MSHDNELRKFMKLPGGATTEVITDSLYFRRDIARGAQRALFFHQCLGENCGEGVLDWEDTNMHFANQLPDHNWFLIQGIRLELLQDRAIVGDVSYMLRYGAFALFGSLLLIVGCKSYVRHAPLGEFIGRAETGEGALFRGGYRLKRPLLLEPHQNFSVELEWKEPGARTDMLICAYLDGERARNVE